MNDILFFSLKTLFRKSKRTFLTALSIAVGVCSVVIISSLGNTGIEMINSEVKHLGLEGAIVAPDGRLTEYRMDAQLCSTIASLEQVDSAAGLAIETGKVRMHGLVSDAVVWGVGPNFEDVMSITLLHGRFISQNDMENKANVCMIDSGSAKDFYKRQNIVGKKLSFDCGGVRQELEIVGIVEAGGSGLQNMVGEYIPSFLYVPSTVLELMTGKPGFSQVSLIINEESNADLAENAIIESVERTSGRYGIFTIENLSKQNMRLNNLLNHISLTLSLIAAISLIVAAIGTMTIMMASVKERTKEIGIKKAIGATNKRIMLEFLTESVMISCVGTAIGSVLASIIIKLSGIMFPSIPLTISGIWLSGIVCIVLGTMFGMIPAKQAARLDPIDALRSE